MNKVSQLLKLLLLIWLGLGGATATAQKSAQADRSYANGSKARWLPVDTELSPEADTFYQKLVDRDDFNGCRLHVVSVRETSQSGRQLDAAVKIEPTGSPMVVVLHSGSLGYGVRPTWHIEVAPDADVRQIFVVSGDRGPIVPRIADPVPDVPIHGLTQSYRRQTSSAFSTPESHLFDTEGVHLKEFAPRLTVINEYMNVFGRIHKVLHGAPPERRTRIDISLRIRRLTGMAISTAQQLSELKETQPSDGGFFGSSFESLQDTSHRVKKQSPRQNTSPEGMSCIVDGRHGAPEWHESDGWALVNHSLCDRVSFYLRDVAPDLNLLVRVPTDNIEQSSIAAQLRLLEHIRSMVSEREMVSGLYQEIWSCFQSLRKSDAAPELMVELIDRSTQVSQLLARIDSDAKILFVWRNAAFVPAQPAGDDYISNLPSGSKSEADHITAQFGGELANESQDILPTVEEYLDEEIRRADAALIGADPDVNQKEQLWKKRRKLLRGLRNQTRQRPASTDSAPRLAFPVLPAEVLIPQGQCVVHVLWLTMQPRYRTDRTRWTLGSDQLRPGELVALRSRFEFPDFDAQSPYSPVILKIDDVEVLCGSASLPTIATAGNADAFSVALSNVDAVKLATMPGQGARMVTFLPKDRWGLTGDVGFLYQDLAEFESRRKPQNDVVPVASNPNPGNSSVARALPEADRPQLEKDLMIAQRLAGRAAAAYHTAAKNDVDEKSLNGERQKLRSALANLYNVQTKLQIVRAREAASEIPELKWKQLKNRVFSDAVIGDTIKKSLGRNE